MPAAHASSWSVHGPDSCPCTRERARCMRKPFGEPAETSARALGCSRLHAGAQRHACPALIAASSPSSRTAPTVKKGEEAQWASCPDEQPPVRLFHFH
eukprot:4602364-Prymnesium_polylepis.1